MDTLAALADPTRRRILELLADGDVAAGELSDEFAVSRPAVSRHLRVLREAGLVQSRVDGQRRVYSLDARPLAELDEWLTPYRRFWAHRLDALDTEIRRDSRKRRDR
ncbi:MAG TPA: metalloregulator ArsR/SmtB family transcription factor [Mycobacteriales bacterium]|jgi:DNA-binding transcriptional ArsR family regulator|nr:metalloregulator ArsR/SmtB family transcription factor [Mycobacteriales bacterium]